ncbi:MAG: hypothetical protein JNL11_02295 [Bdellovibrionaceae bacterium]|nr:hypothetical protein [Pseudobdellovibrionaceae bacterium]
MNLFETLDYKSWVNERIQTLPKGGRGQYKQMSDHMGVNPTIVTQVFNGDRELTPEQASPVLSGVGPFEVKFVSVYG